MLVFSDTSAAKVPLFVSWGFRARQQRGHFKEVPKLKIYFSLIIRYLSAVMQ